MKARRLPRFVTILLSVLFWVGVWWLIAALFQKPTLMPAPPAVLQALWGLMQTATFWLSLLASLGRILLGILLALVIGALLALATVKSSFLDALFSPLLSLFKATPVAAVIFLLVLWLGRERVPTVITLMMALPIVWSNLREGLLQTDKKLLEVTKALAFTKTKTLFSLQIPSLLPYLAAACRSAIGIAWKAGIAAEVLSTPALSIGREIWESKQDSFLTAELFAWTLVAVLFSVLIEQVTLLLLKKAPIPKKEDTNHADA